MYKYANNHVELFKTIPFDKFSVNSNFISNLVNNPEKYGTYENILKVYYFIADELWDQNNTRPLIEYNTNTLTFHFYDFIRKRDDLLKIKRYKPIKLFNGVLDNNGKNRHFKKYHGLVAQAKPGISKKDVRKTVNTFIQYARIYNQDYKFYKRNKFELPPEWAEHLYLILQQLSDQAVFFYKQRGSVILTQEMISVLSNQSLFIYSKNLIKWGGQNRQKIIRQIKEAKQFMFGEITHTYEKHY